MKPNSTIYLLFCIIVAFLVTQCSNKEIPIINTSDITGITIESASSGGTILSEGGGKIISKGLCWRNALERWSFPQEPTIDDHKSTEGAGSEAFTSRLTGLDPGTTYYVRAYAVNRFGIGYGAEKTFRTSGDLPSVSAEPAGDVTAFTANIQGNVDPNNIPAKVIFEYGLTTGYGKKISCTQNQVTGDSLVRVSAGIANLSPNTTYHFRIRAENALGVVYSDDHTFRTREVVTDIDGYVYEVVSIGNQKWMAENLKTSRYRDGSIITLMSADSLWSSCRTGAFSSYDNKNSNVVNLGGLYNWYAVNDSRGLCPTGWHVPSNDDFTIMTNYLGGLKSAGGKMKEYGSDYWLDPNTGADNSSLFSAIGTGFRDRKGIFSSIRKVTYFWTSTEYTASHGIARSLQHDTKSVSFSGNFKESGFAVRCIKDK